MTTSEKQTKLAEIASEIKSFKGLEIARTAINPVPGEGNPDAEIMFIGEAPGFNEDKQGRPFVGQSGKLLEKMINEFLNLKREDVFIANIVKFRPPDNRDPLPEEIEACRLWLDNQIAVIQPKIIVTLGRFSMTKFIPGVTISRIHGQPRSVELKIKNLSAGRQDLKLKITLYPMYHPAAALRAGEVMKQFQADFVKLKDFLPPNPPNPPESKQSSLF